ncbi:MAG: hypothetical protein ACJA08_001367 [Cyclobacteriaceae bacterium]
MIWHYFTKTAKAKYSASQTAITEQAEISQTSYLGQEIYTYSWGKTGPKILLSHG